MPDGAISGGRLAPQGETSETILPHAAVLAVAEPDSAADAAHFLAELARHWRQHGEAAFDAALSKDPIRYVSLAAKLIAGDGSRAETGDLVALLARFDDDATA